MGTPCNYRVFDDYAYVSFSYTSATYSNSVKGAQMKRENSCVTLGSVWFVRSGFESGPGTLEFKSIE